MSNKHDIDEMFKESLRDFEVKAPENAWDNIANNLHRKPSNNTPAFWIRLSKIAAVISVILVSSALWITNNKPVNTVVTTPKDKTFKKVPESKIITTSPTKPTSQIATKEDNLKENLPNNTLIKHNSTTKDNYRKTENLPLTYDKKFVDNTNLVSENTKTNAYKKDNGSYTTTTLSSKGFIAINNNTIKTSSISNYSTKTKLKSLVDVAKEIKEEEIINKEPKQNKWYVKPQISPIYFGNLGNGSAVSQDFSQNNTEGEINMSYGVNLAYQVHNKIKIRSGVNRVNLNYTTNDVYQISSPGFSNLNNINLSISFESSLVNAEQLQILENTENIGRFPVNETPLQQKLGFIEIPMEIEYKLLDKSIGIHLVGGASTFLLNNNTINIKENDSNIIIGEANNINNVSFSTNFAVGFDYDISKKLSLNLEPTIKYQINTFKSGTTDFQPFFLGIYSGVIFKF